ncbi:hypothetical protein DL96DRAFT_1669731 [Flagelloscypha sp. PMI_526]|nr:hypothetical protein DL96DRAFT_1669731 [Flagelloscypha sp. PMI_526]
MASSLLVVGLPSLDLTPSLQSAVVYATSQTSHQLFIVLYSELWTFDGFSHIESWPKVQLLLTRIYVAATKVAQENENILMDVNVLLKSPGDELDMRVSTVYTIEGDNAAVHLPSDLSSTPRVHVPGISLDLPSPSPPITSSTDKPSTFPVVALGGTFDHLHAGHKILLSMGAWITETKLIVGLTDDALLVNKSNKHILESLSQRTSRIYSFLTMFKPSIQPDIVPISDVYGPTGWDPNVQGLVVSKETLSGAKAIATHRQKHNLPALETFVIDVISATSESLDHANVEELKEAKMSSTYIREWIVANPDKVSPSL